MPLEYHPGHDRPLISFPKIPLSLDHFDFTEENHRQMDQTSWVVQEKIHGAHFRLITDGKTLTCAKRKAHLAGEDQFFHFHRLLPDLLEKTEEIWHRALENQPTTTTLIICGELAGGSYPHPEVTTSPESSPVQTGIHYAPEVIFFPFDFLRQVGDQPATFGSYSELEELVHDLFPLCPTLFQGSLAKASGYPIPTTTQVPNLLGLPPLDDNPAEGVVIKPLSNLVLSTPDGPIRPMWKRKIPTFAEDQRYYQSEKERPTWRDNLSQSPQEQLEWEIDSRVNPPRLQSAVSKIGDPRRDRERSRLVFHEVAEDVWDELATACPRLWWSLTKGEKESLREYLHLQIRKLIIANLK